MTHYQVTMQHTEESFEKLSRKQYDLFCQTNRFVRALIAGGSVLLGLMYHESWWSLLLIAYGCYMITSTYAQPNHTAHKMARQIREAGMPFPSARYVFYKNHMEITVLPEKEGEKPEKLKYEDMEKLAEDGDYFYIFRNSYGGYMIPKAQLKNRQDDFRSFIESATGMGCNIKAAPWVKLVRYISRKSK